MFSGSPFLKSGITLAILFFSGKISFSSNRLNNCFRVSLISSKYFLTTLRFVSFNPGLLFAFNEKKPPLTRLLIASFFPLHCEFDLRNY